MARLVLEVGQAAVAVNANDENATEILHHYADAYGINPNATPAQRLQLVANHLANHIQEVAHAQQVRALLAKLRTDY